MRITLALTILCVMVTAASTPTAPIASVLAFQDAAQVPSPRGEPSMGATEVDLVKWAVTQGGLTLVLILVLVSYRRDFFRKNEALREEKRELVTVLDKCANAMQTQAIATQVNTKATELLAQNVNNLAERRGWQRE